MVRVTQFAAIDSEPTAEFNQQCLQVIRRWESGDLPSSNAIAMLSEYAGHAVATSHLANQGRAEHLLGYIQHYCGNLSASIRHYDRARKLYERLGNHERVAIMNLNQGENFRFKGELNRALRLYRMAFQSAEALGSLRIQTMAAVNQGLALLALEHNMAARQAFQDALELITHWTDHQEDLPGLLCEIYHGMGLIYLREGHLLAAWKAAMEALNSARKNGQPFHWGFANRILGQVIDELGTAPDPEFASDPDEYFQAALSAFREINAEAEMARTMYVQALSLAARGRRTTAARKLHHVMIIFERLDMVDDAARAAEAQLAVI
jgi:tetratricopeptide (TPR) repeat protein